jgi:SAM-dependent methyltransferase
MNLFDLIASPYAWFYPYQVRQFKNHIPLLLHSLREPCTSVLDVGCATGAMCQVFAEQGMHTEGCDRSAAMIKHAKRLTSASIIYTLADTAKGLPYADCSFDIVIASFVAHGMPADQRTQLYTEMRRIARKTVLLYDYGPTRHWLSDVMEFLEQGDYFSFIKVVDQELLSFFGNLTKLPVGRHAVWYQMEIK